MILRKMKSSAFLINVARGGVVDEEALMTALDDGLIAGAYVDVFSQEPVHSDSRLIKHPFMYPTPHIAGSTKESLERTAYLAGQSIRQAWDGQRPVHSINTLLRS
jgi:D-3-phosphoglycerate dehydrogenase